MPFGLSNALASFQDYINKIMAKKLNISLIVYLDNILIYTKDSGQPHVNAVKWVHKKLLLEYVLLVKTVQIEDEKIEAVKNWPELKFVHNIQVLLSFTNFY